MTVFKKRLRLILIIVSLLILLGCIGLTAYLLFSNYQQAHLFAQAKSNFQIGDAKALALAKAQLQQVIQNDDDNEAAYIMLAEIAEKQKNYPEQIYYSFMTHRLNPLSQVNKAKYIESLCVGRSFNRLEIFLSQQHDLPDEWQQLLLYAAGRNGKISKYNNIKCRTDVPLNKLTYLLFKDNVTPIDGKLAALDKLPHDNFFLHQEILEAKVKFFLAKNDINNAEKTLLELYELNCFAFAPALGRFYANFRSFDKALSVFEKYLAIYHDPAVAMQAAEIYCLLKQTDKIAELRNSYQSDSGEIAMFCCFYFDALTALANNDMEALKEMTIPLRRNINTPLAAFMFFLTDIHDGNLAKIESSYTKLLAHRSYLDLQERADAILSDFIKKSLPEFKNEDRLLSVAKILYQRKPEVLTAQLILLIQKKYGNINISLLQDALTRFNKDSGIIKIGLEYYLDHDIAAADRLMTHYKDTFPDKLQELQNYEIISALRKKDYDQASELFQKYFSPEILQEYWNFARLTLREKDLIFLSRDKLYAPFCKALLALQKNDTKTACDLLENSDSNGNLELLFFAARILGENGRNKAALDKYALFPTNSPYQLAVLLNQAELFAENGDLAKALDFARQAYKITPVLAETQLCYADKLYKNGDLTLIPDIVKLSPNQSFSQELKKLWIAGMQARIKQCNIMTQKETVKELCRRLLSVSPDNSTALETLETLKN